MAFVFIIAAIVGICFYAGTMSSYRKAGAGSTYNMQSSARAGLTRTADNRMGTTTRVSRGYYLNSSPTGKMAGHPRRR